MKYPGIAAMMLFMLLAAAPAARAQADAAPEAVTFRGVDDLSLLGGLPVLEEGRIKPVETYARNVLLRFSGRQRIGKTPALAWLAKLLFTPDATRDDPVFLINNPEIPMALGVTPHKNRRYHFNELEQGLAALEKLAMAAAQIEEKDRSIVEQELVRVYANIMLYAELSRTFVFCLPHPDFTINDIALRKRLGFPAGQNRFTFLSIALQADTLYELSQPLTGKPPTSFTDEDNAVLQLMTQLYNWSQVYRDLPFQVVPSYQGQETWLSPWDALNQGLAAEGGKEELTALAAALEAYWSGDQDAFNAAVSGFGRHSQARVREKGETLPRLHLEEFYNRAGFFMTAKLLYLVVLMVFLISLFRDHPWLRRTALGLTGLGMAAQAAGIVCRVLILNRPPVSTLYETFVFVGFVSAVLGLIVERANRQWLGIMIAAIGGSGFLMLAGKFASDGDTMKMLVAVLNSNFWLSTHVITITIGYAGCVVAGIAGHVYLLRAMTGERNSEQLNSIYRNLIGTLGFGLTMAFLGTTLGGIWADQSWGRFWGWDPKENGALLIVLWAAILFHARMGGMIRPLGMAVGSVLGVIVVMWAWFGVNLLSVGLHSYGFTSGTAIGLGLFVAAELSFALIATIVLCRKGWKF